ncbi:MAG: HAD hydrolase family protein [Elusimicrobiota bacterium]|nr:HAD hydrolase family protein [Elusimicrobiota bacterium]
MKKLKKFKDIKIVFMDVDGVLTRGEAIFIDGASPKIWYVRDRLAVKLLSSLPEEDIKIIWVSGRPCAELAERGAELGVDEIFSNIDDKVKVMEEVLLKYNFSNEDALYIGDDLMDIKCIKRVSVGCCPADAAGEVKDEADYICENPGGRGAVREIIENILKSKGHWAGIVERFKGD